MAVTRGSRFVGFFDILGSKEFILNNPLLELEDDIEEALRRAKESQTYVSNSALATAINEKWDKSDIRTSINRAMEAARATYCDTIWFADTVLLYTPSNGIGDLLRIVSGSAAMLAKMLENGLPMRGAISMGGFSVDPGRYFVGPAQVQAFALERIGKWSGAILDPKMPFEMPLEAQGYEDTVDALLASGELVRYDVPVGPGQRDARNFVCVNWPARTRAPWEEIEDAWRGRHAPTTADATLKLENTRRFHERFYVRP